jgi:hypothetical protein
MEKLLASHAGSNLGVLEENYFSRRGLRLRKIVG